MRGWGIGDWSSRLADVRTYKSYIANRMEGCFSSLKFAALYRLPAITLDVIEKTLGSVPRLGSTTVVRRITEYYVTAYRLYYTILRRKPDA